MYSTIQTEQKEFFLELHGHIGRLSNKEKLIFVFFMCIYM
jgi:hypothetical protein